LAFLTVKKADLNYS